MYSKKRLMRTLSFTFVFRCLLLVSLSYQIVCFKGQSSQLFIFTVISLLIYISIGLITLLTKMRIMNWYTGKSLSNFKWSIVANPRLDWFSFTPPSDWSKKKVRRSLNQSDAKLKPIPTWSPAFSCALGGLLGFT